MTLDHRRDNRSIEQFSKDIKDGHDLEESISQALAIQIAHNTKKPVKVFKNGVDADGGLLYDLTNHNVDRIFMIDNQPHAVEIKTAPHNKFFTFKVSSLMACVDQDASIVLYIKNKSFYYNIWQDSIRKLLELPHEIYEAFSPNDKAVRISREEFGIYLDRRFWCEKAKEKLNGI